MPRFALLCAWLAAALLRLCFCFALLGFALIRFALLLLTLLCFALPGVGGTARDVGGTAQLDRLGVLILAQKVARSAHFGPKSRADL